jgi:hypothetical protein
MLKNNFNTLCLFLCGNDIMQREYFLHVRLFIPQQSANQYCTRSSSQAGFATLPTHRMVPKSGTHCLVILETKHLFMFLNRISSAIYILMFYFLTSCLVIQCVQTCFIRDFILLYFILLHYCFIEVYSGSAGAFWISHDRGSAPCLYA